MRRRDFLRRSAVASVPVLLQGCGLSLPEIRQPRESQPEDPWLAQFDIDSGGLSQVVDALGNNGGDFGDAFFQYRRAAALRWTAGAVAGKSDDVIAGAGLRVVHNGRSGFRHTRALDVDTLTKMARLAADESGVHPAEEAAQRGLEFHQPGTAYSRQAPDQGLEQREAVVARLDALIRKAEPSIDEVDIRLSVVDEWVLIATLDGRLVGDRRPMIRLSAQAFMTRGTETQTGFAALSLRQAVGELDGNEAGGDRIDELARTVADRTRRLFDSRRPPEGDIPVILSAGSAGVLIHEAVAHALESDFVRQGESPVGRRDALIAAESVTLVDDATRPHQRGSLNVDDEGEPGQRTVLIKDGRLQSLIFDKREALAAGAESTGNGRRESYAYEPLPRASCTYIESGTASQEELLASIERGIVVDTIVGGEVESVAGRFRLRVRHGWVVDGGQRRIPVRDFELTGHGLSLLKDISLVGNDLRFDPAGWTGRKKGQSVPVSMGTPSIVVSSLGVKPLS